MNPDGFDSSTGDVGGGEPDGGDQAELNGPGQDPFVGMVFDDAFVLAAVVHEPSAEERLRALRAGGRRRTGSGRGVARELHYHSSSTEPPLGLSGLGDPYEARRRGRHQVSPGRWQRVVARMMLVVIGMLAVLVAAAAVYRGSGEGHQPVAPVTGSSGSTVTAPSAAAVPH